MINKMSVHPPVENMADVSRFGVLPKDRKIVDEGIKAQKAIEKISKSI